MLESLGKLRLLKEKKYFQNTDNAGTVSGQLRPQFQQ